MKKKQARETFNFLAKNIVRAPSPPLRQLNAISSQTPHQSGQKMPVFPQTRSAKQVSVKLGEKNYGQGLNQL